MEYKFNPQHIADLSGGKVILAHTKKEEDLPLLTSILKLIKPNYRKYYTCKYYFFTDTSLGKNLHAHDYIFTTKQHLPIIPLHDFLIKNELPKEDLKTIEDIGSLLSELKEIGSLEMLRFISTPDVSQKLVAMLGGEMKQAPEDLKYVKCIKSVEKKDLYDFPKGYTFPANEALQFFTNKDEFDKHFVYVTYKEHYEFWQPWKAKEERYGVNVVTNNSKFEVRVFGIESINKATDTQSLIRWVLDNQEQVIKFKNK